MSEHPAEAVELAGQATACPDEMLNHVMGRIAHEGVGRLPVVSRDNSAVLLGIISRRDVLGAYGRAVLGQGR